MPRLLLVGLDSMVPKFVEEFDEEQRKQGKSVWCSNIWELGLPPMWRLSLPLWRIVVNVC